MSQQNPNPVTTRTFNLKDLVVRALGKDYRKPETVYQFSNGRKFESTDANETGIYRRT